MNYNPNNGQRKKSVHYSGFLYLTEHHSKGTAGQVPQMMAKNIRLFFAKDLKG